MLPLFLCPVLNLNQNIKKLSSFSRLDFDFSNLKGNEICCNVDI